MELFKAGDFILTKNLRAEACVIEIRYSDTGYDKDWQFKKLMMVDFYLTEKDKNAGYVSRMFFDIFIQGYQPNVGIGHYQKMQWNLLQKWKRFTGMKDFKEHLAKYMGQRMSEANFRTMIEVYVKKGFQVIDRNEVSL